VPVDITVSRNHFHRVVVASLPLPHVGLVNLIARWDQPGDEQLELTCQHELGHVQTLPLILPRLLLLIWPRGGRRPGPRWLWLLVAVTAHQAAWELAAEGYVILHSRVERHQPRSRVGKYLYAVLWSGMALLAVGGTWWALRRTDERR
jgi:hypothetical protein